MIAPFLKFAQTTTTQHSNQLRSSQHGDDVNNWPLTDNSNEGEDEDDAKIKEGEQQEWGETQDERTIHVVNSSQDKGDFKEKSTWDYHISLKDVTVGSLSFLTPSQSLLFRYRLSILLSFNRSLSLILPLLDLTDRDPLSLSGLLRLKGKLIGRKWKEEKLREGLEETKGEVRMEKNQDSAWADGQHRRHLNLSTNATPLWSPLRILTRSSQGGNGVTVILDNFLASKTEGKKHSLKESKCIFVQAYDSLSPRPSHILRSVWDGDRVFQVSFRGESGSDAGGVFREGMQRIVEDLFNEEIDLFVPCPNAKHDIDLNRHLFLPNPKYARDKTALDMMEFIGKMMGVSLRTKLALPFLFSSYIWKMLVRLPLDLNDLSAVDSLLFKWLKEIEDADEDTFEWKYGKECEEPLKWGVTGADGGELEVGGREMHEQVKFEERHAYTAAVVEARAGELKNSLAAMTRGFHLVVPLRSLMLFTWEEAEVLVCGVPTFDIDDWKKHTHYSGYSCDDEIIQCFWRVIESMTDTEKGNLVRFVWGRSRLPAVGQPWTTNFHISKRGSIDALPQAHTCFNSLELPPYPTESAMRDKLLVAVTYGVVGILNT